MLALEGTRERTQFRVARGVRGVAFVKALFEARSPGTQGKLEQSSAEYMEASAPGLGTWWWAMQRECGRRWCGMVEQALIGARQAALDSKQGLQQFFEPQQRLPVNPVLIPVVGLGFEQALDIQSLYLHVFDDERSPVVLQAFVGLAIGRK